MTSIRKVFQASLDNYVEYLKDNYVSWTQVSGTILSKEIVEKMLDDYNDSLVVKPGKDYYRVFVRGSIHSFVSASSNGKINVGDILRPLDKTTPDLSFVHGNTIEGRYNSSIIWSGV